MTPVQGGVVGARDLFDSGGTHMPGRTDVLK